MTQLLLTKGGAEKLQKQLAVNNFQEIIKLLK